jgi:hypothetical protein
MVPVEGPRTTRFRYPGEVSGPADEEICSGGCDGRRCWGSSACYRGLRLSVRVWPCLLCTGRVVGSCTAHWTLTSQAWTESVPDPRGAWKVAKGGRTGSAAVTAYAVGARAASRAASLTVSATEGASSDESSAMVLGADGWDVLAGGGCVLASPAHRWQRVGGCSRVSAGCRQASRARAGGFAGGVVLCEQQVACRWANFSSWVRYFWMHA